MEGYTKIKISTPCLFAKRLSLVVSHPKNLDTKQFHILIVVVLCNWVELSCLASLAKPYLVFRSSYIPPILNQ